MKFKKSFSPSRWRVRTSDGMTKAEKREQQVRDVLRKRQKSRKVITLPKVKH